MNHEFEVHKLNEKGIEAMKSVATLFDSFLLLLNKHFLDNEIPEEKSVRGNLLYQQRLISAAKNNLEIACFFSKKAISVNPELQLVESKEETEERLPNAD